MKLAVNVNLRTEGWIDG